MKPAGNLNNSRIQGLPARQPKTLAREALFKPIKKPKESLQTVNKYRVHSRLSRKKQKKFFKTDEIRY
jgi:hypothetical protein